jgi:hypothetical protein
MCVSLEKFCYSCNVPLEWWLVMAVDLVLAEWEGFMYFFLRGIPLSLISIIWGWL